MHPIQIMMNQMSLASRQTRSDYQLTLGQAVRELSLRDAALPVTFADGSHPDPKGVGSYRGYYADLAISSRDEPTTCGELLEALKASQGQTFTGYKGGDYRMGNDTPLWHSDYGTASGVAIMGTSATPDGIVLDVRQVD